ncbi:hypothetical protein HK405_010656, partial [Cladochytrium tenue]
MVFSTTIIAAAMMAAAFSAVAQAGQASDGGLLPLPDSDTPAQLLWRRANSTLACAPPFVSAAGQPSSAVCLFGCCLPCPASFAVLQPGLMDRIWRYNHGTVSGLSLLSAAAVVASMLVLAAHLRRSSSSLATGGITSATTTSTTLSSRGSLDARPDHTAAGEEEGKTAGTFHDHMPPPPPPPPPSPFGRVAFVVSLNLAIVVECAGILLGSFAPSFVLCYSQFVGANQGNSSPCRAQV